jgi:hypothetical protein
MPYSLATDGVNLPSHIILANHVTFVMAINGMYLILKISQQKYMRARH